METLKSTRRQFYGLLRPKLSFLAQARCTKHCTPSQTHQPHHEIELVKVGTWSGGGSVMLWCCFSAAGPGRLVKVEGEMNAAGEKSWREIWCSLREKRSVTVNIMTPSVQPKQLNTQSENNSANVSGRVRAQTSIQTICAWIWKALFTHDPVQPDRVWAVLKKNGEGAACDQQ